MTNEEWVKKLAKDIKKIEFALQHPIYANFKINNHLHLIKILRKLNKLWPYIITATITFESQHLFHVTPFIFDERIEKIDSNDSNYPLEDFFTLRKESWNENILWTIFYIISFLYSGYLLSLWYSTRYGDAISGSLNVELNYTLEYQKDYYEILKEMLKIKKNNLQLLQDENHIENEYFSKLSGFELKEFLNEVEKFPFLYRELLNFKADISMGVEIEFEEAGVYPLADFLRNYPEWVMKSDNSLTRGIEINTPIMYNEKKAWQDLKEVLRELQKEKVNPYIHAGTHFHIGTYILGDDLRAWQNFLLMYTYYEDIIIRFFYGERIRERMTFKEHSEPIAPLLSDSVKKIKELPFVGKVMSFIPYEHANALSLHSVNFDKLDRNVIHNTIEFRSPNGTINEVICQNNVNMGVCFLLAAKASRVDREYLEHQLKTHPVTEDKTLLYRYINLSKALEFCDLVFEEDIDKMYFLKQYLKDYQENRGTFLERKIKF